MGTFRKKHAVSTWDVIVNIVSIIAVVGMVSFFGWFAVQLIKGLTPFLGW